MPGGKKPTTKKPLPKSKRRKKQQKKHRGPLMRFRFGRLVLLWILSLIICFGTYIYNRNVHPEKDVFVRKAESDSAPDESSVLESQPEESAADDPAAPEGEGAAAPESSAAEENSNPGPTPDNKVNPVPESVPQSAEYLTRCAFLGETNIFNLKQAGLLQEYNVYASETLNLSNYSKEYVMLDGTTIRILSAINSASCPIYLMFGTESLAKQPPDQTADQFSVLLNSVIATAPEAEIFVLSIPPVTAAAEQGDKGIKNSDIDEYNSLLLEAANTANVYFVDVNTALKNNDSKLDPAYALEDGIHLTTEAGAIMLNYVLSHVPPESLPATE